jgi:hypothetical protein
MGLTDRALAQQGDALHAKLLEKRDPKTHVVRVGIESTGIGGTLDLPGIYNDLNMYEGMLRSDAMRVQPEREDGDGRPVRGLMDPIEAQRAEQARYERKRRG